jgi:hypothetical protein
MKAAGYVGKATDVAPELWDVQRKPDRSTEHLFRPKGRVILE